MSDALTDPMAKTGLVVTDQDGGVRISWSDDPLDFVWQSNAQIYDLVRKLNTGLTREAFAASEESILELDNCVLFFDGAK